MDRSFLSQPEVVAVSRRFVCVRLTTYENEEEGRFLMSLQHTRSGRLENTTFAILAPDGKRQLIRASRSPRHVFADGHEIAQAMTRIARTFPGKSETDRQRELPTLPGVRLAVDVASCDNRPLVVLFVPAGSARRTLEERIRTLAWSEAFIGRFAYVTATAAKELSIIERANAEAGMFVVQPDRFGLKATIVSRAPAEATLGQLTDTLRTGLARYHGEEKSFRGHVRAGHERGVFWETAFPVTDPMERRARESARRRGGP
jgi:hypothetical protein